jgi:hypothetical protein
MRSLCLCRRQRPEELVALYGRIGDIVCRRDPEGHAGCGGLTG